MNTYTDSDSIHIIETDVGAMLNIADQLGAFKGWFEKNTDLSVNNYSRRLYDVAAFYEICCTHHHERGDYDTGEVYGRYAEKMRDLAHGLRRGGQIRETVIVNFDNMIAGVKTTVERISK